MGLFKNIKQKFCNHFFIFDAANSSHEFDGDLNNYIFRCIKCGMRINFRRPVLEESINNTFVEVSNLKRDYLNLLAMYEPENYKKEKKRIRWLE